MMKICILIQMKITKEMKIYKTSIIFIIMQPFRITEYWNLIKATKMNNRMKTYIMMDKNKLIIQWETIQSTMSMIFSNHLKDIKKANRFWMMNYKKTETIIVFKVLKSRTCLQHPINNKERYKGHLLKSWMLLHYKMIIIWI